MAKEPERVYRGGGSNHHFVRLLKAVALFAIGAFWAATMTAAYFTGIDSGFETASLICTLEQANPLDAGGGAI